MENLRNIFWFLILLCLTFSEHSAQQIANSNQFAFHPAFFNPGSIPDSTMNELMVTHNQQHLMVASGNSYSQVAQFKSAALGKHRRFGWGVLLSSDRQHTDFRIGISPYISVKLIDIGSNEFAIGISGGISNWSAQYQGIDVQDADDPALSTPGFIELDAGCGASYQFSNHWLQADASLSLSQLPGNLATRKFEGLRILPHATAAAGFALRPADNLLVGPRFLFREVIDKTNKRVGAGNTDVGLKLQFERQNFWTACAYRLDNAAMILTMGTRIVSVDSLRHPKGRIWTLDLDLAANYPVNGSQALGPAIELGLRFRFSRPAKEVLLPEAQNFFLSKARAYETAEKYLPVGVNSKTEVTRRSVILTYSVLDHSLRYIGDVPRWVGNELRKVGEEWPRVDSLIEGIASDILREAMSPQKTGVSDPEKVESLDILEWVMLSTELQLDQNAASFGLEGIVYEGELGGNNGGNDTLEIPLVLDGIDSVIHIHRGEYLSGIQLASLKLYVLRLKMEHELNQRHSQHMIFVREENKFRVEEDEAYGRQVVVIRKLRLHTNHPNLRAYQQNNIALKFLRKPVTQGFPARIPTTSSRKEHSKKKRRNR